MKCYLHVGTEKTGSTSIQNFLYANQDKLEEQNLFITKSCGKRNNRLLSVAAYSQTRRDDFTKIRGIIKNKDLVIFQESVLKKLNQEVKIIRNQYKNPTFLFSSEHLQSRLTKQEELIRLQSICRHWGFQTLKLSYT